MKEGRIFVSSLKDLYVHRVCISTVEVELMKCEFEDLAGLTLQ